MICQCGKSQWTGGIFESPKARLVIDSFRVCRDPRTICLPEESTAGKVANGRFPANSQHCEKASSISIYWYRFFVGDGGLFPARIMVVGKADLIGRPTMSKPLVSLEYVLFGIPVSRAVTVTLGIGLSAHGYRNNQRDSL
jgi:hypothetical protein